MNKTSSRFAPIMVALGVVLGILIGSFYANHFSGNRLSIINTSSNKINDLLHLIDDEYVDSVNISDLVENALPKILLELDPHSTYITANDVEENMQDLQGHFSGIGIQFTILDDTVRVVKVIDDGPSADVGIAAGDCIVAVDNRPYVGDSVTQERTLKLLKGKKGSKVLLSMKRKGHSKPLDFKITRGDVTVNSIDAVFNLDETTGYMRIRSFGETTYSEFLSALATLSTRGFKALVLDLRGNLGGYMAPAIQIANDFLPENRLIVYTQGRRSPREEYRSDGRGVYQSIPLVLLVDETSASATEILAGALQDNDRATIVGRRTFGKGLVQVPIEFRDGSILRLTKARYYTPSGRCVQKPYSPNDGGKYEEDLLLRAEHGEYFSSDSIPTTGEAYKTSIGRTVYGGGGIIPDLFVPRDTSGYTSYYRDAFLGGYINNFAYYYSDKNRTKLQSFNNEEALSKYVLRDNILEQFATFAEKRGLKRRNLMLRTSSVPFTEMIVGGIISDILNEAAVAKWMSKSDAAIKTAMELIHSNATFPKNDAAKSDKGKNQAVGKGRKK